MQFSGTRKPAIGIIYDSGFGAAIDTVLALALLHGLEGKMQARIAGLTVSNPDLKAAQLCDVVERFYASAVTGQAAIFFSRSAIGLSESGPKANVALAAALLDKYPQHIRNVNETAVPEILIRNALTAQYDGNTAIVLAGPATNLVRLLDLNGARDLIESKVTRLVVAMGSDSSPDAPAAKRLFAEWPTPIVSAGPEIGAALPFPGSSIDTDFSYAPAHPVAAAYRAFRPMPYDAPAAALAAALYAARPDERYFQLSPPGTLGIGADGRPVFSPSAAGKHRALVADPSRKEEILKLYVTLVSAKPVAPFRRIPAAAGDVKAEEPIKKEHPDQY